MSETPQIWHKTETYLFKKISELQKGRNPHQNTFKFLNTKDKGNKSPERATEK